MARSPDVILKESSPRQTSIHLTRMSSGPAGMSQSNPAARVSVVPADPEESVSAQKGPSEPSRLTRQGRDFPKRGLLKSFRLLTPTSPPL